MKFGGRFFWEEHAGSKNLDTKNPAPRLIAMIEEAKAAEQPDFVSFSQHQNISTPTSTPTYLPS